MNAKYKKGGRLRFSTLRRYFIHEYAMRYILLSKTVNTLNARISELKAYADKAISNHVNDFRQIWFLNRGLMVGGE